MRRSILIVLLALTIAGCARKKQRTPPNAGVAGVSSNQKLIVTPDYSLSAKVASVNMEGRFVVLTFPPGHLPPAQQQLNLYRRGVKAGVVRITPQQLNENVIADVLSGSAEIGDEAREK
jgi:hypothetical protein